MFEANKFHHRHSEVDETGRLKGDRTGGWMTRVRGVLESRTIEIHIEIGQIELKIETDEFCDITNIQRYAII